MGWIQEPSSSWSLCPTQAEPPLEEELLKLMEGFKLGWGRGRGRGGSTPVLEGFVQITPKLEILLDVSLLTILDRE